MTDLTTRHTIAIAAPVDQVWRAMTTPELIKQWFFGVDTETDWQVGSSLVHRGTYQGRPYEDKGEIIRFEPPQLLEHSHWSPVSGTPDEPANYQRVTWTLAGRGGTTELTISEANLPSEAAKKVSDQSWPMVMNSLKELLER